MIYLDSAATTLQKPPQVARAVARAIFTMASPGRGGHRWAMLAAETVFRCRETAAELFQVPTPEQVVFTCNATHALNLALHTLVHPGDTVLISGYEHNAVTRPLAALGAQIRVATSPLFQPETFLTDFAHKLDERVSCVVCTHVSNVFGYQLPIEDIAHLCRERGVPFVIDASQSAGCLPVSLKEWGADFIAMPGHKGLYGPQGTGLLLCGRRGEPLLAGGTGSRSMSQEMPEFLPDRLEAGTHNVCGIAGLLEGLRFVRRWGTGAIFHKEHGLLMETARRMRGMPGVEVFSDDGREQSGVLSFRVEGWDCESLCDRLAQEGVALRAGLHCAPYAHRSAGSLESGTLRVSFSAFNTPEEAVAFTRILKRVLS